MGIYKCASVIKPTSTTASWIVIRPMTDAISNTLPLSPISGPQHFYGVMARLHASFFSKQKAEIEKI